MFPRQAGKLQGLSHCKERGGFGFHRLGHCQSQTGLNSRSCRCSRQAWSSHSSLDSSNAVHPGLGAHSASMFSMLKARGHCPQESMGKPLQLVRRVSLVTRTLLGCESGWCSGVSLALPDVSHDRRLHWPCSYEGSPSIQ